MLVYPALMLFAAVVAVVLLARSRAHCPVPDEGSSVAVSELALAVDDVGLGLGVAPAASAGIGEHVMVTATLVRESPLRPGVVEASYLPDWSTARWFDDDGFDSHRDPLVLEADKVIRYSVTGTPPSSIPMVLQLDRSGPCWRPVEADLFVDASGRLCELHEK